MKKQHIIVPEQCPNQKKSSVMKTINDILKANGIYKASQSKRYIRSNSKVNQHGSYTTQFQDEGEGYKISKRNGIVEIHPISEQGGNRRVEILNAIFELLKDKFNCDLMGCSINIKL